MIVCVLNTNATEQFTLDISVSRLRRRQEGGQEEGDQRENS